MSEKIVPTIMADADGPGPVGSCLICGHARTLVVWHTGTAIGACAECRNRVSEWDALEAENDGLRRQVAGLVERVNRQTTRINRAHAALDGEVLG